MKKHYFIIFQVQYTAIIFSKYVSVSQALYNVRNIDVISLKLISNINFFGKKSENNECRPQ